LENWIKVVIFAATITVSTMGCERHKLHIYRTGNVESLHFETSQMECGRLIREDQPAFFIFTALLYKREGENGRQPRPNGLVVAARYNSEKTRKNEKDEK